MGWGGTEGEQRSDDHVLDITLKSHVKLTWKTLLMLRRKLVEVSCVYMGWGGVWGGVAGVAKIRTTFILR